MGSEISTATKPGLNINRHISGYVAGTSKLKQIEIIRNGDVIHTFQPDDLLFRLLLRRPRQCRKNASMAMVKTPLFFTICVSLKTTTILHGARPSGLIFFPNSGKKEVMKSSLVLTIVLALIVMGAVIVGLAIGLLITGKSRLRRGCGHTPKREKQAHQDDETSTCSLCGQSKACEDKDEHTS